MINSNTVDQAKATFNKCLSIKLFFSSATCVKGFQRGFFFFFFPAGINSLTQQAPNLFLQLPLAVHLLTALVNMATGSVETHWYRLPLKMHHVEFSWRADAARYTGEKTKTCTCCQIQVAPLMYSIATFFCFCFLAFDTETETRERNGLKEGGGRRIKEGWSWDEVVKRWKVATTAVKLPPPLLLGSDF